MAIIKNKILLALVIISFALPLGYSFWYKIPPVVDAQAYDRIAINIIDGFGFREDRAKSFEFDTSIVRAGPGYEFFLAGIYSLFGHHYEAVWILQALLHALSALLLFLICQKIFPEKGRVIGLVAAVLFGLHPDLIEISAMLMTETLYLFLIILTVYIFAWVHEKPDNKFISSLLGVVAGASILTRPPMVLFVPVVLYAYYRLKNYRSALIFCFGLAFALLPWVLRNYFVYHQLILTTLIGEYNVWVGNTLLSNGGQISGGFNPLTTYTEANGFFGLKAKASAEFWSFVFGYPLIFIKLCLIRFVRYFSLIRPMGFWFYQTGLQQLIFIVSSATAIALLFWSGFTGMAIAFKERRPFFYYLIILATTSPLVLIPTVVQSRYRFQIYPFLAIFGAYALVAIYNKHSQFKKIPVIVGISLLIISLVDMVSFWETVTERLHLFIK
ncbi:MAG: hypothetical protein A2754_00690 [Candidatus Magasanikbacteria bacterium RIFCSPHIGHO2_01_FULL_47_8]|uniref:Glycosyltransferase RgtA/B/C/D-like domain-containing protein n=1 Tax=Candidatus Magasanikbacteria bacterium RIFCSPHIGHO2_01_FULL_47_8 TaxID=1798673 RepID=A0A1F6MEM5_9BACT|nr:MAG: hypothetical protein A2754_00690 [Candidatus Magasanikbacteria bacterium RIFCSPHIGHO2_01_FULL_47_8]